MISRMLLGCLLAVATIFFGNLFWMHRRRTRAIREILSNPDLIRMFVTLDLLRQPPPSVAHITRPLGINYGRQMGLFVHADRQTERRGQLVLGAIVGAALVGSAVLGGMYFLINVALFGLLALMRPGQIDRERAIDWVQVTAVFLYLWHSTDPDECAGLVAQTPDLQALHAYVCHEMS